MRRRRRGQAVACAVVLGLALALVTACSSNGATCDCADPGITIHIPPDVAASQTQVVLSGPGCAGQTAQCTKPTSGGCAEYRFLLAGAGTCHLEVDSPLEIFTNDFTAVIGSGCCGDYYATPLSAAQVYMPERADGGGP